MTRGSTPLRRCADAMASNANGMRFRRNVAGECHRVRGPAPMAILVFHRYLSCDFLST
jgi:hypothetical protein